MASGVLRGIAMKPTEDRALLIVVSPGSTAWQLFHCIHAVPLRTRNRHTTGTCRVEKTSVLCEAARRKRLDA